MNNKKNKLQKLKERMEELKPLINKDYKSIQDLNEYRNNNLKLFEEYNINLKEIEKLEWDLMTPEEKERHEKYKKFLRLKAKGEPFDLDEFI